MLRHYRKARGSAVGCAQTASFRTPISSPRCQAWGHREPPAATANHTSFSSPPPCQTVSLAVDEEVFYYGLLHPENWFKRALCKIAYFTALYSITSVQVCTMRTRNDRPPLFHDMIHEWCQDT